MPSFWGESLESQEDVETNDNGEHLWSGLLKEVTNKASSKLPSTRALVVLGDDESGKTTLIARIQGTEDPKKSFGLEYSFIDIKDEDRDDHTKLNVWILDGDIIHNHLLKFALTADNFGECLGVIVVNMAEPWNIMKNLEKWSDVLTIHIKRTSIDEDVLNEYKKGLMQLFRDYVEPDVLLPPSTPASVPHTPLPSVALNPRRQAAPVLPKPNMHPATAALLAMGSGSLKHQQSITGGDADLKTEKSGDATSPDPAPAVHELPLDPSTLSHNLGLPLVVVVTKTDAMNNLQKDEHYTEEHFDFIQMHIRRFCLNYGAALFYVSVKEDKNCDLLNRYILSRMYGFPFTQSAYVVERDCVFVPAGWDSEKKIAILEDNFTSIRPDDKYNDIIKFPQVAKKPTVREPEITAQDEQSFLTRLIAITQRESISGSPTNGISGSSDNLFDQFSNSTSSGARASVTASPRISVQGVRGKPSPLGAPTSGPATPGSATSGGLPVGAPGSGARGSENVLANFFTSLLNKRASVTPGQLGAAVPGTSPSHVGLSPGQSPANTEKFAMSPKDIQSELERLARSSHGTPDTSNKQDDKPAQAMESATPLLEADTPSQNDEAAAVGHS